MRQRGSFSHSFPENFFSSFFVFFFFVAIWGIPRELTHPCPAHYTHTLQPIQE